MVTRDEFFVSDGDLKNFEHLKSAEQGKDMALRMTNILSRIENGDFWSIACINGDAYGGGCEMMLAFDFTIARKTAKFALPKVTSAYHRDGEDLHVWLNASAVQEHLNGWAARKSFQLTLPIIPV